MQYVPYQLLKVHHEDLLRQAAGRRLGHEASVASRASAPTAARVQPTRRAFRMRRVVSHG